MPYKLAREIDPAYPRRIPDGKVRETLRELLGVKDPPQTVDYAVDGEETAEGMRIQRLHFANMLRETVTGILIVPADGEPGGLPAVVCTPGTTGDADRLTEERFGRDEPDGGPLRGWARELVRRGFVTLSLTLKMNDARRLPDAGFRQETKFLAPYGISQMGLLVDEVLRGARLLAGHEAVKPDQIGLTGMSLGGNATWYAFACAPWIRAAVPVCGGLGSLRRQIIEGDPERHGPYFYIPHMLRYFDHPAVVKACITPRPLLVIGPTEDEDMPSSGVADLITEVRPAYERVSAGERFSVYRPEGRHEYRSEYFERMVEWFKLHL